jgi:hypothetical protein
MRKGKDTGGDKAVPLVGRPVPITDGPWRIPAPQSPPPAQQVCGASPLNVKRRTSGQLWQLDNQIVKVLKEDHPQSTRHVFYRMTDSRLPQPVEKSDRGYRAVQRRLVELRRSGRVPYDWVTDMSRAGYFVNTYKNAGDFLRSVAGNYRANLWADAGVYVEVWVESRSIASVILELCQELAVDLYPAGGFSSISLAYEAARAINYHNEDRRPVVIFYIGDYDPAGVLIDVSLEKELRLHLDDDLEMEFRRLAITEEQVAAYDLPTKPRKKGDKRAPQVAATVEAEAMPAGTLRGLLRREIEALLPPRALEVARMAEQSERNLLEHVAVALDGQRRRDQ